MTSGNLPSAAQAGGSLSPGRGRWFPAAAVCAVAFAVYAGTLGHRLVWDDPLLVNLINDLWAKGSLPSLLKGEFSLLFNAPSGYYRPVVLLSIWMDGVLAPHIPFIYHVTNVLLHVLISLLVLAVARAASGSPRIALAAALLFAAHPAHTESVAFVSGRTDMLAALFLLASTLAWLVERSAASPHRRLLLTAAAALSYLLACLSKEAAFLLPAALVVWEVILPPPGSGEVRVRRMLRWVIVWAISTAAVLSLKILVAGIPAVRNAGSDLAETIRRTPSILSLYLRLLVFPYPLNAYYAEWQVTLNWPDVLVSIVFVALCVAGIVLGRRSAAVPAGLVWMAAFFLPVMGLVKFQGAPVAERFVYIPSIGFAIVAGALLDMAARGGRWRRAVVLAAGIAILGALAVWTVVRARVWRDDLTLYGDIVRTSPLNSLAYHNLGAALSSAGRPAEAFDAFRKAIMIDPQLIQVWFNLVRESLAAGLTQDAVEAASMAVRLIPNHPEAHYLLGNAYGASGRFAEAAEAHLRAATLDPSQSAAVIGLCNDYYRLGRLGEAEEWCRKAIALSPAPGQVRATAEGILAAIQKAR